jgi:hypothetical protein
MSLKTSQGGNLQVFQPLQRAQHGTTLAPRANPSIGVGPDPRYLHSVSRRVSHVNKKLLPPLVGTVPDELPFEPHEWTGGWGGGATPLRGRSTVKAAADKMLAPAPWEE